jgi:hypothetical protein
MEAISLVSVLYTSGSGQLAVTPSAAVTSDPAPTGTFRAASTGSDGVPTRSSQSSGSYRTSLLDGWVVILLYIGAVLCRQLVIT